MRHERGGFVYYHRNRQAFKDLLYCAALIDSDLNGMILPLLTRLTALGK